MSQFGIGGSEQFDGGHRSLVVVQQSELLARGATATSQSKGWFEDKGTPPHTGVSGTRRLQWELDTGHWARRKEP